MVVVGFSWVGLVGENGAKSREEIVGFERVEEDNIGIGSISCCWFWVLDFLYLIWSEIAELSENTTGMVVSCRGK